MKVVLANPHFPVRTYPGAPMGLFCLKNALEKGGIESSVFDSDNMGRVPGFRKHLLDNAPDVVGITSMSFQMGEAAKLAREAKALNPGITVVLGGPHASVGWKEALEDHAEFDCCCVGDGGGLIVDVCSGAGFENVMGLAYRKNGRVVYGGPRPPADVDFCLPDRSLHFPAYDFDIMHKGGKPLKTAQVMFTRGCPNNCVFCTEPVRRRMAVEAGGMALRRRPLDDVEGELMTLRNMGYEFVYADDSTFTLNREYAFEVSKIFGQTGLPWGCNTRVDCLDRELVEHMASNGCRYMFCGFESAVRGELIAMGKTRTPGHYLQCAEKSYGWLEEFGFDRMAYLIFGGPRLKHGKMTTGVFDDARRSIDFAVERLRVTSISPSGFRILPGTRAATDERYSVLWPGGKPIGPRDYDSESPGCRVNPHPVMDGLEGRGSVNSEGLGPELAHRVIEYLVGVENSGGPRINFTPGFREKCIKGFDGIVPLSEMKAG